MRKSVAIAISFILIMLIVTPTKASFSKVIEDEKGDVISFLTNGTTSKPDVDIKKLTYYQYDDGRVILSLQVYGKIDQTCMYEIDFNTTDGENTAYYSIFYTKNPLLMMEGMKPCVVRSKGEKEDILTDENLFTIIDEDTLRISFSLFDSNEKVVDIVGTSANIPTSENDIDIGMDNITFHNEEWQTQQQDGQQNEENQQNQQNQDEEKESPGFEIILLLTAVFISILILIGKKKL